MCQGLRAIWPSVPPQDPLWVCGPVHWAAAQPQRGGDFPGQAWGVSCLVTAQRGGLVQHSPPPTRPMPQFPPLNLRSSLGHH